MAILIFVHLNGETARSDVGDGDVDEDPTARGLRYQNILICCEMLFFSLTHWCVFPAEEWEKGYEPPERVNQPGIGFQDFVSDVGQIYRRRRKGRKRRTLPGGKRSSPRHRSPDVDGLYHRPATASQMSATAPTYEEYYEEESSESNHLGDDEIFNQAPPRRSMHHLPSSTTSSDFSTPMGAVEEESSSPSRLYHNNDHDLMLSTMTTATSGSGSVGTRIVGPPSMPRTDPLTRPRFMSEGSSVAADDEDDHMDLI